MSLTREHLTLLAAPFKSEEHEFKPPRGYIYIAETAICERIESIDPSWEWRIQSTQRYDNKGAIATTIGHLTILGVTRGGDGQQAVEFQKGTDIESGEAEKGSETDALKRAARKFGIGRYLLDCPKDVKGYGRELDLWLKSLKNAPSQRPIEAPVPIPPKAAQTPVEAHWSQADGAMGRMYKWAFDTHKAAREDVDKAIGYTGRALETMTANAVREAIKDYMQAIVQGAKDFN